MTQTLTDDEFFKLFDFGNPDNKQSNTKPITSNPSPFSGFGDDFKEKKDSNSMIDELISKQYNNDDELNINTDYIFPTNKSFKFKNINICNSKISFIDKRNGILDLQSMNDIIIQNSQIDLKPEGLSKYGPPKKICGDGLDNLYGRKLNQIFIGRSGHYGDSCAGGIGGCGLRLYAKNNIIINNSIINICGADGSRGWRSGGGEGGSLLMICNNLEIDDWSKISKGRVVIKIKNFLTKTENKKINLWIFKKY